MNVSQKEIEQLKASVDLSKVINRVTSLARRDLSMFGFCPFCRRPQFNVSREKQVYHCFDCKKSGNIFTFIQDYYKLSFPEAIERLREICGLAEDD